MLLFSSENRDTISKDFIFQQSKLKPSEYATSVQRLSNVVQTPMTFGQRWVDVVKTSRVHLVVIDVPSLCKTAENMAVNPYTVQ